MEKCFIAFSSNSFYWQIGGDTVVTLGKRAVDALEPREKPYIAWDDNLAGFGVRVMPSGLKTFILDYRAGAGGRSAAQRQKKLGRHGEVTVTQARGAALDALARIRLGEDPQAEKARGRAALTVAELIDAFFESHGAKLKAKTRAHYAGTLGALAAAHGNAKAESLSRAQAAALHQAMGVTPYQANRMLASGSSLYAWGERHGHLPEGHANPFRNIRRYREQSRERFLSAEEIGRLGDALRQGETEGLPYAIDESNPKAKHAPKEGNRRVILDPFAVAAVRLLILTGARLREILHARWGQVDFGRGLLNLSDSKTGRKSIRLPAAALAILADLPRIEGNPHIIPGAKEGEPRFDLRKPWLAVTKAAGLEGLRIHDLRHSHASVGAGAGLSLAVIGALLGHSQPSVTAKYAHLANDPLREASEKIGATISAALAGHKPEAPVSIRRAPK